MQTMFRLDAIPTILPPVGVSMITWQFASILVVEVRAAGWTMTFTEVDAATFKQSSATNTATSPAAMSGLVRRRSTGTLSVVATKIAS